MSHSPHSLFEAFKEERRLSPVFDEAFMNARSEEERRAVDASWQRNFERENALRDLIATTPARTVQDALAQVALAQNISVLIEEVTFEDEKEERMKVQIRRLLLSALRVLAPHAGTSLEALGLNSVVYDDGFFAVDDPRPMAQAAE